MTVEKVDVLLVGGGVMSATLATLLNELDPSMHMMMVERLPSIATESTDAWNNAGTGHAGYCELNYTPIDDAGNISINRALAINASFEVSLQLWASLVEKNALPEPAKFINKTPHLSFVWGEENVAFLRKRHRQLQEHPLFKDMEFSDNVAQLTEWMPLMMQQRTDDEKVAATRVSYGSDVDFGSLTRELVKHLQQAPNFQLNVSTEVTGLKQLDNGRWLVNIKDLSTKKHKKIEAGFVFLGAGGGALKLLQKSGIPESQGYGGFPVSGQWLVCNNPEIIKQHNSKVYGKAAIGAPPMSVPHLDTRIINGKPALLFGPYAGFTTKFLKKGSYLDLFKSVKPNNLKSLLGAGRHNMDLTRYLIGEALQKHSSRVTTLREFYPLAADADWHLESAGKRVQIIKQCDEKGGKLEFGTEIVAAKDGSIAGLLGASPGASVSVQAMINVIERCFSEKIKTEQWHSRIKALIPSYGESLIDDSQLLAQVRNRTLQVLDLR
ncbi:malate dehydrogenase (quinone) [Methylotenera sp.]|uniref:malate dehydrogenase (quinone) n=1 Tax=Methylotenera sp. TaxID=2051956 RepID=UPI002ED926CF